MASAFAAMALVGVCGCSSGSRPSKPSDASPDVTFAAGLAAQQRGDLNQAYQLYQLVLAQRPHNVYARYNLGVIEQGRSQPATALRDYQAALTINPDYVPALFNEATLYATTDPIQAIALYRQILQIQTISPTAQLNLGLIEARQGQTKLANHDLSVAVREDPSLADQGSRSPSATSSPAASP